MNPSIRAPQATSSALPPDDAGSALHDDMPVLVFVCQEQRFAVPLSCVRRAVLSARPSPLPGAIEIVLGVLKVAGDTVTVLDFARRAGCGPTVINPTQQFLIVDLGGFRCALVVDSIIGPSMAPCVAGGWPGAAGAAEFVGGALQLPGGLCFVIEPARFLFGHERERLAQALEGASHALE
ncbi:chemotaxis protein CheW [Massilia sp. LXY-6]|uniref:chemotaxis protein CheW n=1 Tax=Massilia sp. LXY-6 TaxID=3379823 RepID=UPI003EDEF2C5